MSDNINILEKIIQYKKLLLSERFIWLFVSIILGTVAYYFKQNIPLIIFSLAGLILFFNSIALYPWEKRYFKKINNAIESYDYDLTKELIGQKIFLLSYPSKIEYGFLQIQYNLTFEHDSKSLFKNIESLQNRYLLILNEEKIRFTLSRLNIYKKFENIKLIKETLNKLDEKNLRGLSLLSYKLGQSFLYEYNGDIKNAKDLLIFLLDKKNIDKVVLYNAIARLEELQSNYKQAIHYYEKSYAQLKQEPKAKYFHTVLHNIIIINTRIKKLEKSKEWLDTYESMIDKKNLSQYLEFLNTQLLLARQINDRILLLDTYSKMSIFIEPKLDENRWMAHFSSKLRMSFNDGVNFEENLLSAKNLFSQIKILEFPENYFISKEIFYILKTLDERSQLGSMKEFYLEFIEYLKSFANTMHEYKKQLPDLALTEQFFWLFEENLFMKAYISQELKKSNFESLFNDIEQMKRYAQTYNNHYLLVKATMMTIDEFIAYSKVLDNQFSIDFKLLAVKALQEVETLILENKTNPKYFEFFIPTGYYYLELFDDKNKAKEYLKLFGEKKISIEQYAQWQRNYYNSILRALQ